MLPPELRKIKLLTINIHSLLLLGLLFSFLLPGLISIVSHSLSLGLAIRLAQDLADGTHNGDLLAVVKTALELLNNGVEVARVGGPQVHDHDKLGLGQPEFSQALKEGPDGVLIVWERFGCQGGRGLV